MKAVRLLSLSVVLLFLTLFFYAPVFSVLKKAFLSSTGAFTLINLKTIIISPYYRKIILFTIEQSALSTLFALLLGFPGAYLLARKNFPGKQVLKAAAAVPFVLPSILAVLGFVIFFGNNGYINRLFMGLFLLKDPPFKILYSMKAIILAHTFYNFPIAMRIITALWERLSVHQSHAAHSLGAGRFRSFFTITLPQLMPAVLSAASIIFLFCFSSFAIILVLGGGPKYTTIEVEIYRLAKVSFNPESAGSLAAIGIFFSFLLMYITLHFQSKVSQPEDFILPPLKTKNTIPGNKHINLFVVIYLFIILVLVAGPLISVIIKSFHYPVSRAGKDFLSLRSYAGLFQSDEGTFSSFTLTAIKNSLFFAFATVLLSIPAGTILSYFSVKKWIRTTIITRFIDTLVMLPMIVSSVIIGLGYMFIRKVLPSDGGNGQLLIILAHTIIAYPFVVRSITGILEKIKPSLSHAAMSLGASPFRVFTTIEIPLLKGAVMTGAAFAFALSIGELNATILLARGKTVTIPLALYRFIGSYHFYRACALGTILIILTFAAFVAMEKLGSDRRRIP